MNYEHFDIQHDNLEYYFLEQVALLTEGQKELLPKELLNKIIHNRKIKFLEKLYVLSVMGKKWTLVVEGEKKEGQDDDNFIVAGPEVLETYEKQHRFNTSPAYTYAKRLKTKRLVQPDEFKATMNYFNRFLNNYESQRKKIATHTGINMAEWLTLTFLYDGEVKLCSVLYKDKFRYSYNCSATRIRASFASLQQKGYIVKTGGRRTALYQITPIGKQKINEIMKKYVVNC